VDGGLCGVRVLRLSGVQLGVDGVVGVSEAVDVEDGGVNGCEGRIVVMGTLPLEDDVYMLYNNLVNRHALLAFISSVSVPDGGTEGDVEVREGVVVVSTVVSVRHLTYRERDGWVEVGSGWSAPACRCTHCNAVICNCTNCAIHRISVEYQRMSSIINTSPHPPISRTSFPC
jgi:hypothetical protein